jgi:hypothetical protein
MSMLNLALTFKYFGNTHDSLLSYTVKKVHDLTHCSPS